jgi:flagellar hook-basal body complex protein FliE
MAIAPIPPIGSGVPSAPRPAAGAGAARPAAPGFGAAIERGLQQVSALENHTDAVTQSVATGGGAQIHDLMVASTKAQLSVDLLVQVRNRAVEAYQEIMRLQV